MDLKEILKGIDKDQLIELAKAKDVSGLIEIGKEIGKKFSMDDAKKLFAAISEKRENGDDVLSLVADAAKDGKITAKEATGIAKALFGRKKKKEENK